MRVAVICFVCATSILLAEVCKAQDYTLYPSDTPLSVGYSTETGNNTSSCPAQNTPPWCTLGAMTGLDTSSLNKTQGAITTTVDALAEHVSTVPLGRLMYHGQPWTGKVLCLYEPWFSASITGHINVGYDEVLKPTNAGQTSV